jgi:hypothetical protein
MDESEWCCVGVRKKRHSSRVLTVSGVERVAYWYLLVPRRLDPEPTEPTTTPKMYERAEVGSVSVCSQRSAKKYSLLLSKVNTFNTRAER